MRTVWGVAACLLAICVGLLAYKAGSDYAAERRARLEHGPQTIADWRRYSERGRRIGPAAAPVTVVAFVDYECPFSQILSQQLKELREQMPQQLAVVYRNFPLQGHKHALPTAIASVCAAEQGKFSEFHDVMTFVGPRGLGRRPWPAFALASGIQDTASFMKCLISRQASDAVAEDTADGHRLHISMTPTFLVNDKRYVGSDEGIDTLIRAAAVAATKVLSTSGLHP